MTATPKRHWYQFSLKRLMVVLSAAPPLLAGGYWLVQELGAEVLGIFTAVFWLAVIIDVFRNRSLSQNGRIIWLLMMMFGCWLTGLIYVIVRIYDWVVAASNPISVGETAGEEIDQNQLPIP